MDYIISFIKSIFAFIVGIALILLCYYHVHIPVLPSVSIYPIALFLADEKCRSFRKFFVIIGTLVGIACYLGNAILSIIYFPNYLNVFGIILEFVTTFAFISAGYTLFTALRES